MRKQILVVDDEEGLRFVFETWLEDQGYEVFCAENYCSAIRILAEQNIDLVFADIVLDNGSGTDILREIREKGLLCPVVMITGQPEIETAAESVRFGAYDYMIKPVHKESLIRITRMALGHKALLAEKERYRNNLEAIFRSVTEAIITIDHRKQITEANDAVETIFGISPEDMIGRLSDDVFQDNFQPCREILNNTLVNRITIREFRIESPQQVIIVNSSPLLDRNHQSSGAVLAARDITRISELESELKGKYSFHNIIGKSRAMQHIFEMIRSLADVGTTVLISGESGTGKELIAKALHYTGCRFAHPFVTLNCSALSENILESELFGHVRGAFTGASADKTGRFQLADKGSIFLDEIGDISPKVQAKLLRVLQEKEFERVGDSTVIRTDVRVISATNRKLEDEVKQGNFREDLYYRLKVVEIVIPPLRERREDIPLLTDHFLDHFNKKFGKNITGISSEVLSMFMQYPCRGNVRELEHAIEHAFVLCSSGIITSDHIPSDISAYSGTPHEDSSNRTKEELINALEKTGWNKTKAARMLGINRKTIYRQMIKHSISDPSE